MLIRSLTLAAGLTGAAGLSQFPEFSQQYVQRLGGAVDALSEVVADFDASASAAGLSRNSALAEMSGTAFLEHRQNDIRQTIQRSERLKQDLAMLQGAGPFTRAYRASHLTDAKVAGATWQAFRPALPLTFEGVVFALLGYGLGAIAVSAICAVLGRGQRRQRSA